MEGTEHFSAPSVLSALRAQAPAVHCISNIVTAGDVANILLAAGARPIMAQAEPEAAAIAAACGALVLNCGTPDAEKFRALAAAARGARDAGRPIVLDPVGAGASQWRRGEILALLEAARPAVIRCNFSEALTLLQGAAAFAGVDSAAAPERQRRQAAVLLAQSRRCVVLLSGPEDLVSDGTHTFEVRGGSPLMSRVTGTGCMLSGLLGAFCAAEPDTLAAALAAAAFWKACAAHAAAQAGGPGTLRYRLADAAYQLQDWEVNYEYLG